MADCTLIGTVAGNQRQKGTIQCGRIRDISAPNLLSRYNDGQRDQVWQELRQLGNKVRESGVFDEAQLVCDEMARRARHNIETIVERLRDAELLQWDDVFGVMRFLSWAHRGHACATCVRKIKTVKSSF